MSVNNGVAQGLLSGVQAIVTSTIGLDSQFADYSLKMQEMLERQMHTQQIHEQYSMQSNLARTAHESRMSAIRNMRA
jgi:hypothetical protein